MKKLWLLLLLSLPAGAQTYDFNCSSFNGSGNPTACSANQAGYSGVFQIRDGGVLSGSVLDVIPFNSGHGGYNVTYAGPNWTSTTTGLVNIQAFQTTWTWVPNGQNFSLIIQNTTNQPGQQGNVFTTGAGCEASFFQGSVALPYYWTPDHVFALEFSAQDWLTWSGGSGSFSASGFQIYQPMQNPCNPSQGSDHFAFMPMTKTSTAPVPLTGSRCPSGLSCTNGQFSSSGDTYSTTVGYDGYTLSMCMFDVTAHPTSTCSANGTSGTGTYVQQSWPGVYIPDIVGSTTAYVGLGGGVNIANLPDLYVNSWSYAHLTPTGSPSYTAWNAGSTYSTLGPTSVASPVYSVAPGTYSGTQSVSITTSTSPNTYICYLTSATTPTLYPQPDNGASFIGGPQASGDAGGWVASTALVAGQEVIYSNVWYKWSGGTTGGTEPTWPGSGSVSDGSGTWTADPNGGCSVGTRYVSPVSISSTTTLYAMAASITPYFLNSSTLPTGLGPPSTLVAGTYTIGSGPTVGGFKINGNVKIQGVTIP